MKKILILTIAIFAVSSVASCQEKFVTAAQLPSPAKTYINTNFPGDDIVSVLLDDDVVNPDYEVRLASGVHLQFEHNGALEKVACRKGIPAELIPVSIREYVSANYPSQGYTEFEIDRRTYEVTLTNGLELKFNSSFRLIDVDD